MVQAARIFFDGNGVLLEFNIPRVVHAIGGDAENEKQRDGAAEDMTPPVSWQSIAQYGAARNWRAERLR